MVKAVVLAEGCLGEDMGKTANGLVLHSMRDEIVAAIDSTRAGKDAGQIVAGKKNGVPVVASFEEAYQKFKPQALYLGAATVGGVLPPAFLDAITAALQRGLTVYNGLHTFLRDDPRFAPHIKNGAKIIDVRRPPENLRVADGRVYDLKTPRVLVMGTDCAVGKRMTVLELVKEARKRGINAGFVATGQTGCMLGPDAGAVIDRVPSDFCAGQVEQMVCDVAAQGREIIFVYGQASIMHPAYSGVSLSILHGTAPHAIILQHDPVRKQRTLFKNPNYKVAPIKEEIELIERLGTGKVVGIAINGKNSSDIDRDTAAVSKATGLPAVDPLHRSASLLLEAALEELSRKRVYKPRTATAV
jgi:uncharacterized NAD-dependent epimerase/dehydratase family protein